MRQEPLGNEVDHKVPHCPVVPLAQAPPILHPPPPLSSSGPRYSGSCGPTSLGGPRSPPLHPPWEGGTCRQIGRGSSPSSTAEDMLVSESINRGSSLTWSCLTTPTRASWWALFGTIGGVLLLVFPFLLKCNFLKTPSVSSYQEHTSIRTRQYDTYSMATV